MLRCRTICLLILVILLFKSTFPVVAQDNRYPYWEWIKKLSTENGRVRSGVDEIVAVLKKKDSLQAIAILNQLNTRAGSSGNYFKSRFLLVKALWLYNLSSRPAPEALLKQAINAAFETRNDSLISMISWEYGIIMYQYNLIEPAAMYCLLAAQIEQKNNIKTDAYKCWLLGEILYKTRDYNKGIHFTREAIQRETSHSSLSQRLMISRYNTIALCYQKMGNYDSAFYYYDIGMKMAARNRDTLWKGLISGNKGQIYYLQKKYAIAKQCLEYDFNVSLPEGETGSAANTLQWIARINLIEGKKDKALEQVKEAMSLLQRQPDPFYLQNVYYAASEIYRALDSKDSLDKYAQLYSQLHDSLERTIAVSRLDISRIKLANLQKSLAIKNLNEEKETDEGMFTFIISFVIIISTIAVVIVNKRLNELEYQKKLAFQKIQAAEAEVATEKEQLTEFTKDIIERTILIEQLEQQVKANENNFDQEQIISEISHQTITTEEDWLKFKLLFEKIYPDFFTKLKEHTNNVTHADERMAALTRLHLTTKQKAAVLGISPNSVSKAKQRLRQRLNFQTDLEAEEFISSLS